MALANYLPFASVSDEDFLNFFTNHHHHYPLNVLNTMNLDTFSSNSERAHDESDPDSFLQQSLNLRNPSSRYLFPGTAFGSTPNYPIFTICGYNINSIPQHLDTFLTNCTELSNIKIDVLCMCETKLIDELNNLYTISDYHMFTNNVSRNSGGIAVFVRQNHRVHLRDDLTLKNNHIETLFVEIQQKSGNIIAGMVYRRPKSPIQPFLDDLNALMSNIATENKCCCYW